MGAEEGGGKGDGNGRASGKGDLSVCRDFLRNVCTRGDRCKFAHPGGENAPSGGQERGTKLQDKMEFCHDFQNGRCNRSTCRFIHCDGDVEAEFLNSGYLPPGVRDQVIRKGVAVDFPAVNGGIPICKDFLKGTCTREARCRFRHVNAMEYDMEMNSYQTGPRRRSHPYGGGGSGGTLMMRRVACLRGEVDHPKEGASLTWTAPLRCLAHPHHMLSTRSRMKIIS